MKFALLHGGGQGSWVWDDVAARLKAAGAEVLALDVPGCGVKRDDEAQRRTFLPLLDRDNWPPGVTYAAHWDYAGLAACRSTYILCEHDGILPCEWQRSFAARLQCERVISIDAGHQAMISAPQALAALLLGEAAG